VQAICKYSASRCSLSFFVTKIAQFWLSTTIGGLLSESFGSPAHWCGNASYDPRLEG
jgi:hypothetical protein